MSSPYDDAAVTFERFRALPSDVPSAVRTALLSTLDVASPHILDLGAGTGRIGRAFVAAGDNYIGADLSFGMLSIFAAEAPGRPRLVQAAGERLPFANAAFDVVLAIQVLGAVDGWPLLVDETRRVLRPGAPLVVGRSVMPPNGVDARMRRRLAALLDSAGAAAYHSEARAKFRHWLEAVCPATQAIIAAEWDVRHTPRAFLDRQRTGAHFARLPERLKDTALAELARWAAAEIGSLDAAFIERHALELRLLRFEGEAHGC